MAIKLAFRDKAGREHMTEFDGLEDGLDQMEDLLRTLVESKQSVPE